MARSRRKTPIAGMTTAESDKQFKRREHRRFRAAQRSALSTGEEPPYERDFGNPWGSEKDGKRWHGDRFPELLRK